MDGEAWFTRARRLLELKGIPHSSVATTLNLSKSAVSMKLRGERPPTLEELHGLCTILSISMSELCDGDDTYAGTNLEREMLRAFRSMNDEAKNKAIQILDIYAEDKT